jgi:hypothetical protein
MALLDIFRRSRAQPVETRSSGAGYTAAIMSARESWISGRSGLGELTGIVQACVSLWEGAFALADVQGANIITRRDMALAGRGLALRGEALFLIRETGLVPVSDWELSTRDGVPRSYRLSIPEAGGGRAEVALAAEVLHFRIAPDPAAPWSGRSPLSRASLSAGLLNSVETALAEVYDNAPLGSQVVPLPELAEADKAMMARSFRGQRGRVLLRESVNVTAAGGPAPQADWHPQGVTPDMRGAMPTETLEAARVAVCAAFGVLPGLFAMNAQGPLVREAQRHLAAWTLQPIGNLIAEEATAKLGATVTIDTILPLQAHDAGGRARALSAVIEALGRAKELGLSPEEMAAAGRMVNFGGGSDLA